MGIINFRKYVSAAILLASAIPFQASAGQMSTIKAIAGVEYVTEGTNQRKNIYVVMNNVISCGSYSNAIVKFQGVSVPMYYQAQGNMSIGGDPWFDNYSLLLTAAQNNLSIEINQATSSSAAFCQVEAAPNLNYPTPYLIHFQ